MNQTANNVKQASVIWNGGYIHTDSEGLKGKDLAVQKRLIKAVKAGQETVVTSACDELPISYAKSHGNKGKKNAMIGDKPADAFLHIRISPDLKASAAKVADARGVSLSQLVVSCLESVTER